MANRIVVAGHACLDITPVFAEGAEQPLQQLLAPGKLVGMHGVTVSAGGCVSNTGLGLKILGAEVSLMAKLGEDEFGLMLRDIYRRHGADDGLITSPGGRTSYSVVLAPPGTDRIFLHDPGANDTFVCDDLDFSKIAGARLFHFGYPPLMQKMYENDGVELEKIFSRVKECGVETSLDLAMVGPNTPAGRAEWQKILARVLPLVDFFVPSIEELCFMLDRPRYEAWQARAMGGDVTSVLSVEEDIRPVAEKAMELGAGVLLIKCGAPGIYLCTAKGGRLNALGDKAAVWAEKRMFEKSYRPSRVLSGTGAGDTSIAAFLKAATDGCPPEECLQLATATGACCVETYDALSGLKPFDELRRMIAAGWLKS